MKTSNKKTILSKTLALMLSLVLALTMSVSAFATVNEAEKATITVNGMEAGGSAKLYKLISLNYDYDNQQLGQPRYSWENSIKDWLDEIDDSALKSYIKGTNQVTDEFLSLDNDNDQEDIKYFVNMLEGYIKSNSIAETSRATVASNATSVKFSDLEMGEYLILVKGTNKIYNPILVNIYPKYDSTNGWVLTNEVKNQTVTVKGNEPSIKKTVNNKTFEIGKEVTYTIDVDIPQYPENATNKKLYIGDKLPKGLTFNADSLNIKAVNGSSEIGNIKSKFKDYTTNWNNDSANTDNEMSFVYMLDNNNYSDLLKGNPDIKKISVTYNATVNSDAYDDTLTNKATFKYSNDPFDENSYNEKTDKVTIYTYGLKIVKEDENGDILTGAQFELKNGETNLQFTKSENATIYTVATQSQIDGNDTVTIDTIEVGGNGVIIKGLNQDCDYTLTEIKAPEGYMIPSTPDTKIKLLDNKPENSAPDGSLDSITATGSNVKNNGAIIDTTNKKMGIVTIVNYKNDLNLPTTGGMGTMIFTVTGILLMGGAVVLMFMVAKKRKVNE